MHYAPACQKLIVSKYGNVTSHFKGNFLLNHNQVVKSSNNQYFGCLSDVFIIFTTLEKYERGSFKTSVWIALTYTWDNKRGTDKLK